MNHQILITGATSPKIAPKALAWLIESVAEIKPDEIVCFEGSTQLLDALRGVYDGPIGFHAGDVPPGVTQLPEVYSIAPGWICLAGEIPGVRPKTPGDTALRAAQKLGTSVVMGHTRRMGVLSSRVLYGSVVTSRVVGIEVGTLADTRGKRRDGGWQQGFGVLTVMDDGLECSLRAPRGSKGFITAELDIDVKPNDLFHAVD